jgi:hypothetical protein
MRPVAPLLALLLTAACTAQQPLCGPCGGSAVHFVADPAVFVAGATYELCEEGFPCEQGPWLVPSGRAAPPDTPLSVAGIAVSGWAGAHSRKTVEAVVRDKAGQIVGQGRATFPYYEQREPEGCECYEAHVDLHLKAVDSVAIFGD